MGIDMEIDLTMGLAKPKIAFSAVPIEGTPDTLEADIPDFSALLGGEKPDDSIAPDAQPLPELSAEFSRADLQDKTAETTANLEPEAKVSPELAAKIAPDNKDITAQAIPNIPVASAPPEAGKPSASQPVQTPAAEIFTANRMVAVAQPARPARATGFAPEFPNTAAKRAQSEPAQNRDKTPELPKPIALDSVPTAKAQNLPLPLDNQAVAPSVPIPSAAIPPVGMPSADIPSAPMRSAIPDVPKISRPEQTPPKFVGQTSDQPASEIGFTNIKTVVDDPAEIQFNIKIERQAVETVHITRATLPAAPVASQITAQLPQLLTKVDKQTIELRLDPPELGRVTIHLTTNDQQVTAQVIADRPDTVDLMRRHAELLTATLARAGFSQADLSFQQGQGQHQKDEFMQFQSIASISESDDPALTAPTLTGLDGRLDIRL